MPATEQRVHVTGDAKAVVAALRQVKLCLYLLDRYICLGLLDEDAFFILCGWV